jgi:hypothetical protein
MNCLGSDIVKTTGLLMTVSLSALCVSRALLSRNMLLALISDIN